MDTIDSAITLAAEHGLHLTTDGATVNEAGLDYRVVMASDHSARRWVLRIPRRPDVANGMAAEIRTLDLVAPVLATDVIAVPDWQIRSTHLIAYPALPGAPGLTLSATGDPIWHMDPASPDYATRLGRLLARLHSITPAQAAAADVDVRTPAQVRQAWRDDIEKVRTAFAVAPALAHAWDEWLADDTCWPQRTVMTHGEPYPAHILLDDDGAITGVLDWTTARVDDPARDLAAQYGAAGEAMLQAAVDAYADAGGDAQDHLVAQARHLWDASPIAYACHALSTLADTELAAAAAMLNPHP